MREICTVRLAGVHGSRTHPGRVHRPATILKTAEATGPLPLPQRRVSCEFVTDPDSAGPVAGYFDSPFPGEDGGPRRQLAPRSPGLALEADERLAVTTRRALMSTMVVLRDPGEVFLMGHSPPSVSTTAWVERIDPVNLTALARSPDLPGGPFWPGGILVHQNGDLYVTFGRYCHRLDPGCKPVASRELPQPQPYNSLIAMSDGALVMKNFVRDASNLSYFSVLSPGDLSPLSPEVEVREGSIARISRDITRSGEFVYIVGDHAIFRYRYEAGNLERDRDWEYRYRTLGDDAQSYGWDPVIAGGNVWFMDNGANNFQRTARDTGIATGPLHVIRVSVADSSDAEMFTPFDIPRGTIVNPPLFDPSRNILVAYDSGNSRIGGFRYSGPDAFDRLWEHEFGSSNHFLLYPDTGEIVVNDFDGTSEHVVVLEIESGRELGRVATGSPVQSVVFQSPGWNRDVYTSTFTTLSRTFIE